MPQPNEDVIETLIAGLDGTPCDIKRPNQSCADLVPHQAMVDKLGEYQRRGYTILPFTSSNMKTYGNHTELINKHTSPILLEWLAKWNVPHDEILFGKPWPGRKGSYIDDRSILPDEFSRLTEAEIHRRLGLAQ